MFSMSVVLPMPCDDSWHEGGAEVVGKFTGKKKAVKKTIVEEILEGLMAWPLLILAHATGVEIGGEPAAPKKEEKEPKLTPGESKVLEAVQEKLSKIGFSVKIRVLYLARRDIFNKVRLTGVKGAMNQFGTLDMNTFKAFGAVTPKPGGIFSPRQEAQMKQRLFNAYRGRSGSGATAFYLNTEELATIYHFPMLDVKAPLLKKTDAKRSEPPTELPTAERYASPKIGKHAIEDEDF